MKYFKWALFIVIFAVCIILNRIWGYSLIDGIVAGVLLDAGVVFFLGTIKSLRSEKNSAVNN